MIYSYLRTHRGPMEPISESQCRLKRHTEDRPIIGEFLCNVAGGAIYNHVMQDGRVRPWSRNSKYHDFMVAISGVENEDYEY